MGEILQRENSYGLDAHRNSAPQQPSSKLTRIKCEKQTQHAKKCNPRCCDCWQQPVSRQQELPRWHRRGLIASHVARLWGEGLVRLR